MSMNEMVLFEKEAKVYRLKKNKQDWAAKGKMTVKMMIDGRTGTLLVMLREKSLQHCIYGRIPRSKGMLCPPAFDKDRRTAILALKYTTSNHRKTQAEADLFCLKFLDNAGFKMFRQEVDKVSEHPSRTKYAGVLSPISRNIKANSKHCPSTRKLIVNGGDKPQENVDAGVLLPVSMNVKAEKKQEEKKRKHCESAQEGPRAKRRKKTDEEELCSYEDSESNSTSSSTKLTKEEEDDDGDFEDHAVSPKSSLWEDNDDDFEAHGFDFGDSQDPFAESFLVARI